jgi:hypothetical protein
MELVSYLVSSVQENTRIKRSKNQRHYTVPALETTLLKSKYHSHDK